MSVNHSGHRDRLRVRLEAEGASSFSDQTLFEYLLTYAILRKDTEQLSADLLARFHTLGGILAAPEEELMNIDGISERTAQFIKLLDELDRRIMRQSLADKERKTVLDTPQRTAEYVYSLLRNETNEQAFIILTDIKRNVICHENIAAGTLSEVTVYPRTVAEKALLRHAHAVILAHCHPSGDPSPSQADIETTRAVQNALSSLGIALTDHLIVGQGKLYSFAARDYIIL